jgi:chlorobactene glucosyltransferase
MQSSLTLLSFLIPLSVIALISILNALTFPRLKRTAPQQNAPLISVLMPMRNEAGIIEGSIKSLLNQDYPNLELLILDDQSTDASAGVALQAANADPRFKLLKGESLPSQWMGKAWACHQLSKQAKGDYLLFTDADVHWAPNAITALIHEAKRSQADLLTGWATQRTETWSERLIVPMMGFAIQAYLPIQAVHYIPFKFFAAANGQCLLFKREAYQAIGGHATAQNNILDDMAFAYAVKGKKLRLRAVETNGYIQTRMYRTWNQVRDGFAKNILAGHGNNIFILLLSTVFHWWLFILPALFAVFGLSTFATPVIHYALLAILAIAIRALTASVTRQRLRDSFLLPVSVILMTIIAMRSIHWHFTGGPRWKGRTIQHQVKASHSR